MAHTGSRRRERDAFDPSLDDSLDRLLSPPPAPTPPLSPAVDLPSLTTLDDRRFFNPEGDFASPSLLTGVPAQISRRNEFPVQGNVRAMMESGLSPRVEAFRRPAPYAFRDDPRYVAECVRRKQRREVMFSLDPRKRKRGSGGSRRRDWWSDVHC